MNIKYRLIASTAALAMIVSAQRAVAQDESAATAAPNQGLEDIVVTARKRPEKLQETPIAITAFSSDSLTERNVAKISEVARFAPNVTFNDTANIGAANGIPVIYIRGVGQDDFTMAIDPGVGLYVDGVYVSRSVGGVLDVLDFDRLEVLRGPQGTLFGRNTIGGAISITSRKPGNVFKGKVTAEVGSYAMRYFSASVDLPVTSTLSIGLSGMSKQRDGYVHTYDTSFRNLGDENKLAGRAAVRWTPSDQLEINIAADILRQRELASPNSLLAVNTDAPFAQMLNASLGGACAGAVVPNSAACFSSFYIASPKATYASYRSDNPLINNAIPQAMSPNTRLDVRGGSISADYSATDSLTIKSITALRSSDSQYTRDADETPFPLVGAVARISHRQFSQEVQLTGEAINDRLKYILGGYYFTERGSFKDVVDFYQLPLLSGGYFRNSSYAAFAQSGFEVTDALTATAGLRYTKDIKRYLPDQYVLGPNAFGIPTGTRLTPAIETPNKADAWTPYVNLTYKLRTNSIVYLSYSEGFKGGGFTQRVFPPINFVPSFKPETVKVYEAGFKFETLDRRYRLNGAAYWNDYSEIQVLVAQGVAPTTQNAAKARIKGFELEALATPTDGLNLQVSAGYTDARYRSLTAGAIAAGLTLDKRFANTPKWSLSTGVSYDISFANGGQLTPRLDWSYSSGVYRDALNAPILYQRGYSLVDASMSYVDPDNLWRVAFIAKNVTDKQYLMSGQDQLAVVGVAQGAFSRPRTFSVQISRKF